MRNTAPPLCPLRILLADDNEMILTAVRGLLQSLGHAVETVVNGRAAIESASRNRFDFVFLDMQMPEMDGIEAARYLSNERAANDRPRIIGLSGECTEREFYTAFGMDEFLAKPVRLEDLVQVLQYKCIA
jgi:CheY-like chemotaxis protein